MVSSTAGPEQEYFLIDRNFFFARPDLLNAGRTLFGAKPPKGQEFEDHYFGAIPERVLAFMLESERDLFKLGIPIKTRHNEVAPAQYEIAPIFENANVATDHQQLDHADAQARGREVRHGVPAARKALRRHQRLGQARELVAGQQQRRATCSIRATRRTTMPSSWCSAAAVIRAVHKYSALLAGRRGPRGQRSSPGSQRSPAGHHLDLPRRSAHRRLRADQGRGRQESMSQAGTLTVGVDTLPPLPKDAGDRNRTSPFAFTGNRFEFRAVGSNQSIAGPLVAMNTIVAESLDYCATELENATGAMPSKLNAAVQNAAQGHHREAWRGRSSTATAIRRPGIRKPRSAVCRI